MNDYPPFTEPAPLPGTLDPLTAHPYLAYFLFALAFLLLGMWLDRILRGYQVRQLQRQLHESHVMLHGTAPTGAHWATRHYGAGRP